MPTPSNEAFEYTDARHAKKCRNFALLGSILSAAFIGLAFYALVVCV